jgi:hypothetical protein
MSRPLPRCMFSVRYPAGDGHWWYQRMSIANPDGAASVAMEPPLVGDLISLWDTHNQPEGGPVFRVVDRCWGHAAWGSVIWPYGAGNAAHAAKVAELGGFGTLLEWCPVPDSYEHGGGHDPTA